MRFSRGSQVFLTYDRAQPQRDELVLPVTIVEDAPDRTVAYLAAGTPIQKLVPADGSTLPRDTPYATVGRMKRVPAKSIWVNTNVLICWQPAWTWDVRLMWDSDSHEFLCWYVNIQDPIRRTDTGFHTTDHFVDVVVASDKSWELKDEAELEDATELGLYTADQAAEIQESLAGAIRYLESWGWPFNSDLTEFAPDSEWSIPELLT